MIFIKGLLKPRFAGSALGALVLASLTGCIVRDERPRPVYVAPPVETVVVQDDYIFYPRYNVYYSSTRHQYAYLEGRAWVSRPAPRGVSVDILVASPSVRMDFHDSPANHHAEVVRRYPRDWKGASNQNRGDEKHDERR